MLSFRGLLAAGVIVAAVATAAHSASAQAATTPATSNQAAPADQQLALDIFKELVEINTSQSVGDTFAAANAMAARLKAAGFPDSDVQTFETGPKRGNLVARIHGKGQGNGKGKTQRKPILLLAHIDVVEAKREDWSTDPFKLVEQDGYYYGRGTGDDKYMAAAFVSAFVRYRKEGYKPDRDIILALTTDEEISDRHGYGIKDLIKNHRALIDAEFAINEGRQAALGRPADHRKAVPELLARGHGQGRTQLAAVEGQHRHAAFGRAREAREL
jgi:acetylornithine deacetylase/succinyl-diaminopimelate desuccinylase-like protein